MSRAALLAGPLAAAFMAFARVAVADPTVVVSQVRGARALTALDDTRACQPLAGGGYAAGTGGGLVVLAEDGTARALTSLDGLPETRIHAIAQQGDGIWVGTEAGAARVTSADDGTPRVDRTVLDVPVHALHVATDGALVLGTRGAGVFRLAKGDVRPERIRSRVASTRVTALAELDGVLHVAHADGPVARLVGGELMAVAGSPTHGQSLVTAGDELLLGDLTGLYRGGARGFTSIGSVDARALAVTGSADPAASGPQGAASLLVGTWGAGLMTGTSRGALRAVDGIPPQVRAVGALGARRCAATTEGLFLDEGSGRFRALALGGPPSSDVTALAVHASGRQVAVGTFDAGATLHVAGAVSRVAGLAPNETIAAMTWQGDSLWVATAAGLVRVGVDGTARRFTRHHGLPHDMVRAVHVLASGGVVAGTDAGPALLEGDRITPLVATPKGTSAPLASPMHSVWALASAPDGTLYIGTNVGLYVGLDVGKGGHFERASLASGALRDDWVTALAVSGRDVWVGTYAKGVTRLTPQASERAGAPARALRAVHLGGGYVNPGGLVLSGGTVQVATMEHLLTRPEADDAAPWTSLEGAAPGRDVTQVRRVGTETWVASRRGIGISRLETTIPR